MIDPQIVNMFVAMLPTMIVVGIGILVNNARLSDLRSDLDRRFGDLDRRFNDIDRRFEETNRRIDALHAEVSRRFDQAQEIWRAELHRVEEVLDARLKHIEESR